MSLLSALSHRPQEYKRRIWAWTMYDWANSAFATTILAAVLPVYFSQVAGATLPSATVATAYWSTGLSLSLLIVAIISPILGTISDVMRGKKRFLAVFAGIGIVGTALLVLVGTGDWVLASILGDRRADRLSTAPTLSTTRCCRTWPAKKTRTRSRRAATPWATWAAGCCWRSTSS